MLDKTRSLENIGALFYLTKILTRRKFLDTMRHKVTIFFKEDGDKIFE